MLMVFFSDDPKTLYSFAWLKSGTLDLILEIKDLNIEIKVKTLYNIILKQATIITRPYIFTHVLFEPVTIDKYVTTFVSITHKDPALLDA